MSILFLTPRIPAPSELWMHRILECLAPDVDLIATSDNNKVRSLGSIPVVSLRKSKPAPLRLHQRAARRLGIPVATPPVVSVEEMLAGLISQNTIDSVLVQYLTTAVTYREVLAKAAKPLFIQCHGYDVTWDTRRHENPNQRKHPDDYVDRVLQLAPRATFIANSQQTAQTLRDVGISPDRIRIAYLGVPVPGQPPQRSDKTAGIKILFLGRLIDFKGPDQVIRAFELASQRGLIGELILAGDGELRAHCEMLRASSPVRDRISLLGAVSADEGEQLRAQADIFTAHNCTGILTGQVEAFGVSIVEAMADALPVVTGRNGAIPEVITDGKNGILVEPNNLDAHADALVQLAGSPELRRTLGENAWQEAHDRFSSTIARQRLRSVLGLPIDSPAATPIRHALHAVR